MTIGATYVSSLALWAGQAERIPGGFRAVLEGRYGRELDRFVLAIAAFSVGMGAMLGLVARILVALRDRMARRRSRQSGAPYALALEVLGVVAMLHAMWVAWGMAHTPGLYAASFYARGGLRRLVQVLVSDALGPRGIAALAVLLLIAYLAGPREQWPRWPGRLRRAFFPIFPLFPLLPLPLVAACFAVFGGSCARGGGGAEPAKTSEHPPRMNILILAADSLRADRLDPKTMPRMSELAARATVFDEAHVSLPRTFPSWVTLLTGRHPHHHGIVTMFPRWEDRAKDFDALPGHLSRAGYRTLVVSDFVGDIFGRIDLGFSEVDVPSFDFTELLRERIIERETPLMPLLHTGPGRRLFPVMREVPTAADPEMLADEALDALDALDARREDAPFFMTVFFGAAHFPYAAPAPHHRRFTRPEYRGPYKYGKSVNLEAEIPPDSEDIAQIRGLYDGAVAGVDEAMGRILNELERRHLAERTLVVLLADHGEALFEPGRGQGHGDHLFGDEQTHIPLVIFDPRKPAGRHESRVVRDVDLAPTLYDLAGITPPGDLDGRSLVPALSGEKLPPALAYAETGLWFTEESPALSPAGLRLPYPGIERITEIDEGHHRELVLQERLRPIVVSAKHRMVRDERFKLVYAPTRMGAKYMLFDTEGDPGEERDVASEHPAEVARLGAELRAYILRDPGLVMRNGVAVPRDTADLPLASGNLRANLTANLGANPSAKAKDGVSAHEAHEVNVRFVETLGEAERSVPNLKAGLARLESHWRKMDVPFLSLSGDAKKLAMSVALQTSERERPWVGSKPNGTAWAPNAKIWNMHEGSFDQRESIFAPPPATLSYRLRIPPRAVLAFSAATVSPEKPKEQEKSDKFDKSDKSGKSDNARKSEKPSRRDSGEVVFAVSAVDATGIEREVCSKSIAASSASSSTWHDMRCPMEEWAGHDIELRFKTRLNADSTAATGLPLAFWGHPVLLANEPTKIPYNIVWIVIDALRPDVLASFHDDAEDAKKRAAPHPPLDALLPKIEGLTPAIDALAKDGVRFTHAYSASTWTRPGTLAMLAGARSTELGVDTLPFVLPDADVRRYYASDPPLLSRILKKNGVLTRAFVNNFFMSGYASAGLDMGFEGIGDHRYHARDTAEITRSAVSFIRENAGDRFFLFCNYNSPHAPWEPPARFLERVPPPPVGPPDKVVRAYMAEAAKDDEAVGELVRALDDAHLRDRTLVIVTADHGETLSSAHGGTTLQGDLPVRFHHAAGNYEETSRIPILAVLPGVLPAGRAVAERVRSIDIAPTVLELVGLAAPSRMSGQSMLSLVRGHGDGDGNGNKEAERPVLTEGRGTRALLAGRYRLLVRDGDAQTTKHHDGVVTVAEELFDLEEDPGERNNLARLRPDVVEEMRARLAAAERNVAVASSAASTASSAMPTSAKAAPAPIHLRFAGGGAVHRISGRVHAPGASIRVDGAPSETFHIEGSRVDFGFATVPNAIVGFDLHLDPVDATVTWDLYLDERPWPVERVFAGPLGLWEASLRRGLATDEARAAIVSRTLPEIDPARDLGLFVTRAFRGVSIPHGSETAAGGDEMIRMLRAWGYATSQAK